MIWSTEHFWVFWKIDSHPQRYFLLEKLGLINTENKVFFRSELKTIFKGVPIISTSQIFKLGTHIKIWSTVNDFNVRKQDLQLVTLLIWHQEFINCLQYTKQRWELTGVMANGNVTKESKVFIVLYSQFIYTTRKMKAQNQIEVNHNLCISRKNLLSSISSH